MSTEAKSAAGRPTTKFVDAHFSKKRLQDNKSKKWLVSCNYCNKELIHRDNRCAHHIINRKECPDAPEHARQQALLKLKDARQAEELEEPIDILKNSSASTTEDGNPDNVSGLVIPVKRPRKEDGKLTTYLEKPLDQRVQDELDLRLIRSASSQTIQMYI